MHAEFTVLFTMVGQYKNDNISWRIIFFSTNQFYFEGFIIFFNIESKYLNMGFKMVFKQIQSENADLRSMN